MGYDLIKPQAWTLSPQMTAAPNLWRDITFLLPLWEGASAPNDVSSWKHSVAAGDNAPSWSKTEVGMSTVTSTTNQEWVITDKGAWDNTDYHTVFGVVEYNRVFNQHIMNWGSSTAGSIIVRTGETATEDIDFIFRDNADSQTTLSVSTGLNDLDVFVFVGKITDGDQQIFIGRVSDTARWSASGTTSLSGGTKSGAGNFYVHNHPSATASYQGHINMIGHAHAFWDTNMIDAFLSDPFSVLRPAGF